MRTALVTAFCCLALGVATAACAAEFPARIEPGDAAALPADRDPLPGDAGLLLLPRAGETLPAAMPRGGAPFRAECLVYLAENGILVRRFAIHVPDRDGLAFARKAGRFLALLWGAANRRLGTALERLRGSPLDVWLSRSGSAGGEQFGTHLIIYDYLDERTGIEWARELAHEYGHYVLPGARGYAEPEDWSNGVLGERLFLRWLRQDVAAGTVPAADLPWVGAVDLADYEARQVDPVAERWRAAGPHRPALAGTDRRAMDAFTGLVLYADDVYGPRAIPAMLDYLLPDPSRGARGPDFLDALQAWLDAAPRFGVTVQAGAPTRLYLPRGLYAVRADGPRPTGLQVPAAIVRAAPEGWLVRVPAAGWRPVLASGTAGRCPLRWSRR